MRKRVKDPSRSTPLSRRNHLALSALDYFQQKDEVLWHAARHTETDAAQLAQIAKSHPKHRLAVFGNPNITMAIVHEEIGLPESMSAYLMRLEFDSDSLNWAAELWTFAENPSFPLLALEDPSIIPAVEYTLRCLGLYLQLFNSGTVRERKQLFLRWIQPLLPEMEASMEPAKVDTFRVLLQKIPTRKALPFEAIASLLNATGRLFSQKPSSHLCNALRSLASYGRDYCYDAFVWIFRYASAQGTEAYWLDRLEAELLATKTPKRKRVSKCKK